MASIVGIDIVLRFVQGEVEQLPFADWSFDVVISNL